MRLLRTVVVGVLALLLAALVSDPASAGGKDHWRGSKHVKASAYKWVDDDSAYEVMVVRGLTAAQVRHTLGTVDYRIADQTPAEADEWVFEHEDPEDDAGWPKVAQIQRRGPAVWVLLPGSWILSDKLLGRLSRKGKVGYYITTTEDFYVQVASKGKVIRNFDAQFGPSPADPGRPLPEEKGLDWDTPDQIVSATAWAFIERVTRIHLSQKWVLGNHPTYVYKGRV